MKIIDLKKEVCKANKLLPQYGLVILTWGNVSAFDIESKLMVIKPSGVAYEDLTPENMVVVDLDGNIVDGELKPSSDTYTHLEIYKNFSNIKSIVHTHSQWATIWAQMGKNIPPLGTTHADDFGSEILCTRAMSKEEIEYDYEKNTGKVIVETLNKVDIKKHFAVLVKEHGPFIWESNPVKAVEKALVLEYVAKMAWYCTNNKNINQMSDFLLKKHFERKHGENAYYGQGK